MSLRRHQRELMDICRAIKQGAKYTSIIASVTPGGGKSLLPVILASELLGSFADKICWVVPRTSLQRQAEETFLDQRYRIMLGHSNSIRKATNEMNPCRGLNGYVTTYAALAVDKQNFNASEFMSNRKYILVLDEPHHIAIDGEYHSATKSLVDNAKLVLYMSGTLERHDELRIAFMPYREIRDNSNDAERRESQIIDLQPAPDTAIITYGRAQALLDNAIIRLRFNHIDSSSKWLENGVEYTRESLSDGIDDHHKALWTALSTKFAYTLLDKSIESWKEERRRNPRAKLLIVAARQSLAQDYRDYICKHGIRAGLATQDEGLSALRSIVKFKSLNSQDNFEALVTVQMAYEGLDCPQITHIACLTTIRSKPWLEQMLARATRFDPMAGEWSEQYATVYVPDDPIMKFCIEQIIRNDDKPIPPDPQKSEGLEREAPFRATITPLDSTAHSHRESEMMSDDEKRALEHAAAMSGMQGVSAEQLRKAISLAGYLPANQIVTAQIPASEKESNTRREIETHIRRYAKAEGKNPHYLSAKVKRHFGKSRQVMTLIELDKCFSYVRKAFPMSGLF